MTGASSPGGRAVIASLLAEGWHVVGTSRQQPPVNHPRFRWHCLDLADDRYRFGLKNAVRAYRLVRLVHCAPEHFLAPVLDEIGDLIEPAGNVISGSAYLAMQEAQGT